MQRLSAICKGSTLKKSLNPLPLQGIAACMQRWQLWDHNTQQNMPKTCIGRSELATTGPNLVSWTQIRCLATRSTFNHPVALAMFLVPRLSLAAVISKLPYGHVELSYYGRICTAHTSALSYVMGPRTWTKFHPARKKKQGKLFRPLGLWRVRAVCDSDFRYCTAHWRCCNPRKLQ